ncbi:MAG: lysostaphin resistance A-like protein [Desulfococcaceae bacterium]
MASDRIQLKLLCYSLFIILIIEMGSDFFLPKKWGGPYLLIGLVRITEILFLLLMIHFSERGLNAIGLGRHQIRSGLEKGIIWSLGFGGLVCAGFLILHLAGTNPLKLFPMRLPQKMTDLIMLFAVGGVIGPVAEEIFFRGIVYGFFRRWGIAAALLISTSLFAVLHSGFGIIQIIGGIIFALAYEKEGKLMTPLTIHILGNTALFALPLLR